MPLLDIVGVDATNSTFYAGFAFLWNEKQDSYEFVLSYIKSIYQDELQSPTMTPHHTILVGKDKALINAIDAKLPYTRSMTCIWHINKNIPARAKPLFRRECSDIEDQKEFSQAVDEDWKKMLGTVDEYGGCR